MNMPYRGTRTPVKREKAERYMLLSVVSFAATVVVVRLFLQLTGYPQVGSSELHLAHLLWGGLALFIAALLPLILANRWAYTAGALLSGIGVGLFIDEVGKFITQNNDYFYPPAAPIIYGFDRREADAWWLVQWREDREIVYESERTRTLVWWTDDPSANIAWAVTGPDSNAASSRFQSDDYGWLRTLNASVAGNERQGVLPYPLSIRGFRDRLAEAPALPELLTPVDSLDPLGIRRALATRDYTVNVVERLTAMAVDTALSQPLRLALYFYHNATQSLDRLDSLLYDAASGPDILLLSQANWANPSRKDQAVATLTQMLEWEKQASQQVAIALQVRENGTR